MQTLRPVYILVDLLRSPDFLLSFLAVIFDSYRPKDKQCVSVYWHNIYCRLEWYSKIKPIQKNRDYVSIKKHDGTLHDGRTEPVLPVYTQSTNKNVSF